MSTSKEVILAGTPIVKEGLANGSGILPGMLVERGSTSGDFQAHSNSGQTAAKAFALIDDLQGNDIDDAYTDNNRILVGFFRSGDEVNALLADDQTAVVGSKLKSNGDGYLTVDSGHASNSDGSFDEGGETVYDNIIVGVALEALDLSSSSGVHGGDTADFRIRIEII